jgi:hypothetical protein
MTKKKIETTNISNSNADISTSTNIMNNDTEIAQTNSDDQASVLQAEQNALDISTGPGLAEKYRAAALSVSVDEHEVYRGASRLMAVNAARGVNIVLAFEARLRAELVEPKLDVLKMVVELSIAYVWACEDVIRCMNEESKKAKELLTEASERRRLMLDTLRVSAAAKVIPKSAIEKLYGNHTGPSSVGMDCVAAVKVFHTYAAALKNRTALTQEDLDRTLAVGEALLASVRPYGATEPVVPKDVAAAIALRDGIHTLLVRNYDYVLHLAGWLYGAEVGEVMPNLIGASYARKPKDNVTKAKAKAEKAAKDAAEAEQADAEKKARKAKLDEVDRGVREAEQRAKEVRRELKKAGKKGATGVTVTPSPTGTPGAANTNGNVNA